MQCFAKLTRRERHRLAIVFHGHPPAFLENPCGRACTARLSPAERRCREHRRRTRHNQERRRVARRRRRRAYEQPPRIIRRRTEFTETMELLYVLPFAFRTASKKFLSSSAARVHH